MRIFGEVKMPLCCWIRRRYCAKGVAGLHRWMWLCGLLKSIEFLSIHFGRIENHLDFTVSLIGTEANCEVLPARGNYPDGAIGRILLRPGDGRAPPGQDGV